jgi:hypothetical protein
MVQARAYCRRSFIGAIRIAPHWFFPEAEAVEGELRNLGFAPCGSGATAREPTGLVDVARSDEELLGSFSKSARREVYRAERQGVAVRAASGKQEVDNYFRALDTLLRERRCIPMKWGECVAMYEGLLKTEERGTLLTAWKDATFLGGLLIVRSPTMAHGFRFVIAPGALTEMSNLRLAPLIWMRGMCWARDRGCRWLDLEGYLPITDTKHPLHFVYRYKTEFSPLAVDRLEPHVGIGHPLMYQCYLADRFVRGRLARALRSMWARLLRSVQARNRAG